MSKLETLLIHAGAEVDPATRAVAPPIHLATTFEHAPDGTWLSDYQYVREGNPTQARLETALAAIEGGAAALFFASGVAAGTALLETLAPGSHILFPTDIYSGFRPLVRDFLPRRGLAVTRVDMCDLAAVTAAIRPETRLVWAETPSNPLLRVSDLAALSRLAHAAGAELLVDSTFAPPVVQRPLDHGADLVLHSATKYFGGHSDVQGGALIFRQRGPRHAAAEAVRTHLGGVASPFNAWLVLRGLRSLACRCERHSANALAVAQAIVGHPWVAAVYYPGLPDHPGHAVARRQMRSFGGMLAFELVGGREAAVRVASRVRLFVNATSLGGCESLIEHRASIEGPDSPTPTNLLRVSVGLEHPDDLVADLLQALAKD